MAVCFMFAFIIIFLPSVGGDFFLVFVVFNEPNQPYCWIVGFILGPLITVVLVFLFTCVQCPFTSAAGAIASAIALAGRRGQVRRGGSGGGGPAGAGPAGAAAAGAVAAGRLRRGGCGGAVAAGAGPAGGSGGGGSGGAGCGGGGCGGGGCGGGGCGGAAEG